jgi:hypothetical protein
MGKNDKTICIDFDGVLAKYGGWKGEDHFGEPIEGAKEFLEKIKSAGLDIVIFTTRNPDKVREWCRENDFPEPREVTNIKIPAPVYIDDRAIKFEGDFSKLISDLKDFNVHWKSEKIFEKYFSN